MHLGQGLLQRVLVFLSNLLHPVLAVQPLSDHLVRLHKLVDFSCELVVLVAHYPDVTVHRVNFDLQSRVVLKQCVVRVPSSLKLLAHVHNLVFPLSDLGLQLLDGTCHLHILAAFIVDPPLEVTVFLFVTLLQTFQMV